MRKIIGIVLILAAGGLGYLAYNEYREHNKWAYATDKMAGDMNKALGDLGVKAEIQKTEKEIPKETIFAGAGAVLCLLAGAGLIVTGK